MMNYPYPTSPGWCYPDNAGGGEAAAEDYNGNSNIVDMFGDYTTDDLFEVVWRGGGGGGTLAEPAISCHRLSPRFKLPSEAGVPEMLPRPPSEDEMAALLYEIIKGGEEQEHAHGDGGRGWTDNNGRRAPSKNSSETSVVTKVASVEKNEKLPTGEDSTTKVTGSDGSSSKRRKVTEGAVSHQGEPHKLAEKTRRCKLSERFKTLQHLVPGCDKSSYNSTLEQTIQYMMSLQQQVQALATTTTTTTTPTPTPSAPSSLPSRAAHPVAQPLYVHPGPPVTLAPMVVLGPVPMVPLGLGRVLPLPHYPAPVVVMPAAATPMYTATPDPRFARPDAGLGRGSRSSIRGKE